MQSLTNIFQVFTSFVIKSHFISMRSIISRYIDVIRVNAVSNVLTGQSSVISFLLVLLIRITKAI